MRTTHEQVVAVGPMTGMAAIVFCGVLVTAALVVAVRLGIRVRRVESAPPRRSDHPTLPPSGPVREERIMREPNEVAPAEGKNDRLTPYQLGNAPSRPSPNQVRSRWQHGSSGSSGRGGSGAT
ncbi:hypothetical protein BIV25_19915 [Streptomyces sp. MUSC 14]|uniref:DUF6479 family protein n=1 Tax=Streptomyces sp. MUSC 14 TaxID=1354889 RepID=UPI000922FFF1|nr:DUF6479 family protein [Streptomyces sp. MUSC 14]OIJ95719.1 hypothetical protein BIV25_19915 [Streptomyces sp. MUSC 14]